MDVKILPHFAPYRHPFARICKVCNFRLKLINFSGDRFCRLTRPDILAGLPLNPPRVLQEAPSNGI